MTTYPLQIEALLITRKHWRHQTQRTIKNALGEDLPFALVFNRGLKEATKGWTSAPFQMCWRSGTTYLNRISRASRADVECGWGRGLTLKQSRERWSRHGSIIPGNHLDNHSRFGITGESWVRMRWARSSWAKRRTQGWSGRAITQWLWRKTQDQSPQDKWSVGCPAWYAEHQP